MRRLLPIPCLTLAMLVGVIGCAGFLNPPRRLFDEARSAIEKQDLETAYRLLAQIRKQYPDSPESAEAFPLAAAIFKRSYLRSRYAQPDSPWLTSERHFMLDWLATFFRGREFPQAQAQALFIGMPYGFFREFLADLATRPELARWVVRAEDDNGIVEAIAAGSRVPSVERGRPSNLGVCPSSCDAPHHLPGPSSALQCARDRLAAMSVTLPAVVPPPPPELRVIEGTRLPLRVEPFALLTPLEGEFVARAGDDIFRLHAGELLVLRRGVALQLDRAGAGARMALFHASPAWVGAFRVLHGEAESVCRAALDLVPAGATLARRAAQLLAGQQLFGGDPGDRVSAVTVAALLEVAFEARGSPLDPRRARRRRGGLRETLLRAIADYDPEADGDFSLCGLAERLGLSERHTARLVRGETGRSFRELKAAAQLECARRLLASSELPILEVALRAGWSSASQFHEAFRRSVGVTPARYRSAHRG